MKKIFGFMVVVAAMVAGCDSEREDVLGAQPRTAAEVAHVCVDYVFSGGDITRGYGDDLYTTLYNRVLTKELAADSYALTFTNVATGESYTFSGNWRDRNMVSLKTGRYRVKGSSVAYGEYVQDKCSLVFDTEVDVKASDYTVVLQAQYDCFLLIFDKAAVKEAAVHYSLNSSKVVIAPLFEYEGAIYGFSRGLYNEAISMPQFLVVTLNDGSREDIQTNGGTLTFEKGRYYLYSGMKGNFLLPRMEAGVF